MKKLKNCFRKYEKKKKEKSKMSDINLEIPALFYNSKKEDQEAYFALVESGIPCEFLPPSEEPTPLLLVGFAKYIGLQEIKEFIESERAQELIKKKSVANIK